MNNKKVLLTLTFLWLALVTQSQISPEIAKSLLGDHFISIKQAAASWKKIDSLVSYSEVDIPYDGPTIEWFKDQNLNGTGDFYLVPTIGLNDSLLKKFWSNYRGIDGFPEKTQITYRLINLKPSGEKNAGGLKELLDPVINVGGEIMPIMDYLETIATIFMVTGKNLSPQFNQLLLSVEKIDPDKLKGPMKNFKGDLVLAYSAIINGNCHEVITTYYPKESFISGTISNNKISLLATETDGESMIFIPLTISCLSEEKDYYVGISYFIKP
ncbi:MAG: hypothetical protein WCJ57_02820 [Candidatus Falkowbacteria bacterium]